MTSSFAERKERLSSSARAIRLATRRPERFPHASMGMLLWLTLAWVMLWGTVSVPNFVSGFLLALLVTTVAPFPATPFDGRFRPLAVVRLAVIFLRDIVSASFQQAGFILSKHKPQGAIIRVQLRSHSDTYLAMIAGMTALVPGSVVVDAHRISGTLYIHVFDVGLSDGVEGLHATVLELEERVLRAFASHDELVDAGFVPGSSPSAGRLPRPYAPAIGPERATAVDPEVEGVAADAVDPAHDGEAMLRERVERIAGNRLQGEENRLPSSDNPVPSAKGER